MQATTVLDEDSIVARQQDTDLPLGLHTLERRAYKPPEYRIPFHDYSLYRPS